MLGWKRNISRKRKKAGKDDHVNVSCRLQFVFNVILNLNSESIKIQYCDVTELQISQPVEAT